MQLIPRSDFEDYRRTREAFAELRNAGDEHAADGQYDQAELCYRQAAVLVPDDPAPHVGLGVVAMQTGRVDEALRAFQTALAFDPDCLEACAGMGMVYQDLGQSPRAFEMYLRCLELQPDNLMALLGLFQASCQMGTFAKIIFYLEQFLQKHPDDHMVLFCLATLYAREDRLIPAKQALLTVIGSDPDNAEALELLQDVNRRLRQQRKQEVA